ncbi:hypothetical protein [Kitasatospora sp. NPDC050543]|uniref:hypothetical protein n=1 Tax=Kitasatospora sp. NPDC050543 TaxID=3364054 RepID=UPI0037985C58
MGIFGLVLALVATAAGTAHVVGALGPWRAAEALSGWILAFAAQLIASALLVGAGLGQFRPLPLLAAAVLPAAAEIAVVRTVPSAAARYRESRAAFTGAVRRALHTLRHPVTGLFALLMAAQYAWRFALGAFVLPVEWDGMWYHLVGPGLWIQQGYIGHTPAAFWSDVYPQGQEVIGAWPGVFLHTLHWSWAAGIPFVLLGFSATVSLALRCGARRHHALIGGFGFLGIPAVLAQSATSYVDVAAATTAAAAFQFVLAVRAPGTGAPPTLRPLWLAGLALAVATSVKPSNLLTVGCVAVVAAVQAVAAALRQHGGAGPQEPGRGVAVRAALVRLPVLGCALLLPSLLLSSYWYLRTWLAHGNPFFPFTMLGFSGRGTVQELIMDGNTPQPILGHATLVGRVWESWTTPAGAGFSYDERLGGLGGAWLWVLFPAVLAALVLFVRRRRWAPVFALMLPMAVMAAASPGPWWARYTLYLPILGGACLAALLTALGRSGAGVARPAGSRRHELSIALAAGFLVATATSMWPVTFSTYLRTPAGHATASDAVDLMRDPVAQQSRLWPWIGYGGVRALPDGSTIAITDRGTPIRLPLMGLGLERRLVQVTCQDDLTALTADLGRSGAQYLALDPDSDADRALLAKVSADPRHFRPVGHSDAVPLFAVGDFG